MLKKFQDHKNKGRYSEMGGNVEQNHNNNCNGKYTMVILRYVIFCG